MRTKRVLITGGAGFIGTHLAENLLATGYRVRVLDNFSAQVHGENPHPAEHLDSEVELIQGDVRSAPDVKEALRGVDVVFHFAASVGVGQSMYEVKSYIDNNAGGTASLLQALIEEPVEKLIVASSMSIYGEGLYTGMDGRTRYGVQRKTEYLQCHDWEPRDESGAVLRPIPTPETKQPDLASIYALSKYMQEKMCLMLGQTYKIPTVALRFFNVYGPRQLVSNPYTGVMATFGSRLLNDSSPIIFEDGNQRRDFVHVSDVAESCRLALEVREAAGLAFNIGSGEHHTIFTVAEKMAAALGKSQLKPKLTGTYRVGDIRHCFADISLAKSILHYEPRVDLSEGISELAEWLRSQKAVDRSTEMHRESLSKGLAL